MRTLIPLLGNNQRLDGGALFGNAPKAMWSNWLPPDPQNRIVMACRALLVREDADPEHGRPARNILFETGIGAFFDPKMKERFGVEQEHHVLLDSLADQGLGPGDIDVVVLSHLHFDHAGGMLTAWQMGPDGEAKPPELLFKKASIVISEAAWRRARNPHPRDRASFIPALNNLLQNCGRLVIATDNTLPILADGYELHYSNGHTPGLLLTEIESAEGPVLFASDLIPALPWVHLPITMGYDRYPELVTDEKRSLLSDMLARGGRLFFTHDPKVALAKVAKDDRGRYFGEPLVHQPIDV